MRHRGFSGRKKKFQGRRFKTGNDFSIGIYFEKFGHVAQPKFSGTLEKSAFLYYNSELFVF
jgi:hypothetical protein